MKVDFISDKEKWWGCASARPANCIINAAFGTVTNNALLKCWPTLTDKHAIIYKI